MQLDEKDLEILAALEKDSRQSLRKLSKSTNIPMATVHHRILALRRDGVIKKYTIELDHMKTGTPVLAFMLIETAPGLKQNDLINIGKNVSKIREVEQVNLLTGVYDMLVRIRTRDMERLSSIALSEVRKVPGVTKINTMISMYCIPSSL